MITRECNTSDVYRRATYSDDEQYRYALEIRWVESTSAYTPLMVIGLNPSTATEAKDDPTIRRCVGFSKSWGFGGLVMTNLFAFRSTDPKRLLTQSDPIGFENDIAYIAACLVSGPTVLAAWGSIHSRFKGRAAVVVHELELMGMDVVCLGVTANGSPRHPLYVPKDVCPIEWSTKLAYHFPFAANQNKYI